MTQSLLSYLTDALVGFDDGALAALAAGEGPMRIPFRDRATLEVGLGALAPDAVRLATRAASLRNKEGFVTLSLSGGLDALPRPALGAWFRSLGETKDPKAVDYLLSLRNMASGSGVRYGAGAGFEKEVTRCVEESRILLGEVPVPPDEEAYFIDEMLSYLGEHAPSAARALCLRIVALPEKKLVSTRVLRVLANVADESVYAWMAETLRASIPPDAPRHAWLSTLLLGIVEYDAARAYDTLGGDALMSAPYEKLAIQLLDLLVRDGAREKRGWFSSDPRFRTLAAHGAGLAAWKKSVRALYEVFPEAKASEKRTSKATTAKPGTAAPSNAPRGWLAAYAAGQHRETWRAMMAEHGAIRDEPLATEAWEVASETMRRVAANIRTIVAALKESGYAFVRPERVHVPPRSDVAARIAKLEARVGALPLSLRAAWTEIGSVDLSGSNPTWPRPACLRLPGVTEPPEGVFLSDPIILYDLDDLLGRAADDDLEGTLPLFPDAHHKAGFSGGPEVCIAVPNGAAEALLQNEPHRVGLVEYFRASICRYAGFVGLETQASPDALTRLVEFLKPKLIDF